MTVPELKNRVYLLPEVAWPIIKQNVANTGNRLQCFEVTSMRLANFTPSSDPSRKKLLDCYIYGGMSYSKQEKH